MNLFALASAYTTEPEIGSGLTRLSWRHVRKQLRLETYPSLYSILPDELPNFMGKISSCQAYIYIVIQNFPTFLGTVNTMFARRHTLSQMSPVTFCQSYLCNIIFNIILRLRLGLQSDLFQFPRVLYFFCPPQMPSPSHFSSIHHSTKSYCVGRDSSVGIAIRYGLDGPGIESR